MQPGMHWTEKAGGISMNTKGRFLVIALSLCYSLMVNCFVEVYDGIQLISILLSIVTTLYIGSGPVHRGLYTIYRAQTSKRGGSDTSKYRTHFHP